VAEIGDAKDDDPVETVPPSDQRKNRDEESRGKTRRERAPVTRTRQGPPEIHEIYEHQLRDLLKLRRDRFSDAFAISVGAAVALIPSCVETLDGYFWTTPQIPITPIHLAELVTLGATCAVAVVCWIISDRRSTRAEEIASQVRGQPAA